MATTKQTKGDVTAQLGKLSLPKVAPRTTAPVIQEVAKIREVKTAGRKSHRKDGVEYVRISPAIPRELKQEMDIAIKSHLSDRYPTIDTFIEAAVRVFLSKQ
jgi:hypothetical protein